MASENQILRQKAFSSFTKHVPDNLPTPETNEPQAPARKSVTESDSEPKKPPVDRQHVQTTLVTMLNRPYNECVIETLKSEQTKAKPVAAFTIYKCLVHWKSFESERTSVFDRLIQMIGSAIEAPRASKGVLRPGRSFGKDSQSSHSQGIVDCLNTLLKTLKDNFVPPIIVQKISCQVFSYINVQLFD
ncbi:unconventional myosin, partial [Tanacetum coccineum]